MLRAASGNDYQKDQQFRKLNKEKDSIEVKAVRGGVECLVTNTDVVVGDILLLDTGDKLVADGIAVEAFGLVIDEARSGHRLVCCAQQARVPATCAAGPLAISWLWTALP